MTRNYMPLTVPGTARTRAVRAVLNNTYGQAPSIHWVEEDQVLMADGTYKYVPKEQPLITAVDAIKLDKDYAIYNPDTGEYITTVKGIFILATIQGFYMIEAQERDALEDGRPPLIPSNPE